MTHLPPSSSHPRSPVPIVWVAAALLMDADNRVLLAQRPGGKRMAGLWEFPGGKIEAGETPEMTLVRELREELGIETTVTALLPFMFASHTYPDFHLVMPLFICRLWQGIPRPREGQKLVWATKSEWHQYPMPPADEALLPLMLKLMA